MLRPLKQNKRGQVEFAPIVLVGVIIGLIIFAPIMLRIIGVTTGTFFNVMNTTEPEAVAQVTGQVDKVYNFFDYLIVLGMFINIIVLFLSAWFIDTNPIFLLLYIMFAFILVLFLPNMLEGVDAIYDKMADVTDPWGSSDLNLPYTEWIRQHFVAFVVGIIMLSGIITYAKFKSGSSY
jgi:hypothetical protein